tara:strand:+ start:89 stop:244 length:156 start_codon:yes stop_codon:yes gene_type:complete
MTVEEQLNQKQAEIHFLQMRLKNKVELLDKIKELIKQHEKEGEKDDEVYWC